MLADHHPDTVPAWTEPVTAPERIAELRNLMLLVQLRWLAVAGQLVTILVARFALDLPLPLQEMLALLALLALFNVASWLRTRASLAVTDNELLAVLLVDVAVLSAQLYFSGGITNPFIFLFLLQVVLGAVLLRRQHAWVLVFATSLAFAALSAWHRPLGLLSLDATLPLDFLVGLLACFVLNAGLLVVFISRISRNLRSRDAALASLRQRAAEQEHIVRMGLLASGAAHELGTPLATLSVILGDWSRMAPFVQEPELREEIEEMQRQIGRCKVIVSGILASAGEARAVAPVETTLHAFLDEVVAEWQRSRAVPGLAYVREGLDVPIISDLALQQMVSNILDNALEAAPHTPPEFRAAWDDETLTLRVRDRGPGFPAAMLERIGTPYQSSKGTPGRGLGLFLAVNVVRTLGGRLRAHNLPRGGAEVEIILPLSALAPDQEPRHPEDLPDGR